MIQGWTKEKKKNNQWWCGWWWFFVHHLGEQTTTEHRLIAKPINSHQWNVAEQLGCNVSHMKKTVNNLIDSQLSLSLFSTCLFCFANHVYATLLRTNLPPARGSAWQSVGPPRNRRTVAEPKRCGGRPGSLRECCAPESRPWLTYWPIDPPGSKTIEIHYYFNSLKRGNCWIVLGML